MTLDLWEAIAAGAARESPLWVSALRPDPERNPEPVFSRLSSDRYALGVETIYEGYLLHYGTARLFSPASRSDGLLLGDYLYAHGLVRIAELHDVQAVADLAALISLCAQLRADGVGGDGAAWAATAALLGTGRLDGARDALRLTGEDEPLLALARLEAGEEAVEETLAAHRRLMG